MKTRGGNPDDDSSHIMTYIPKEAFP